MENYFDNYTCFHLASGITAYYAGLNFISWVSLHIIFSIFENSEMGLRLTKKYLYNFKAYKTGSDSISNLVGDTLAAIIGWKMAYYIGKLSEQIESRGGRAPLEDNTIIKKVKTKVSNYYYGKKN